MTSHFGFVKLTFRLITFSGYFVFSQQINWTLTVPESINVSINSTVEIPCSSNVPDNLGNFLLIWYMVDIYGSNHHQQVYNSQDSSGVNKEYRNRTSLVGSGIDCSLRISNVKHTAWFFPEITINSTKLSNEQTPVRINVTGCFHRSSCSDWNFRFPRTIKALRGSCLVIPCTLTHPTEVNDFNLLWFFGTSTRDIVVYNNKSRDKVDRGYKGRTSLVQMRRRSCSLRINNVQNEGQYYPGISRVLNACNLDGRVCTVSVSDFPLKPVIKGAETLIEGTKVNITCAVNHTCVSSPPTLTWNMQNYQAITQFINRSQGNWEVKSAMLYSPSLKDNNRSLECNAAFQNGPKSMQSVTLHIEASAGPSVPVITIIALAGVAFLLLLLLLVFFYKRKKICQTQVVNEVGQSPQLTYAELEKKDVANDYYDTLKVENSKKSTIENEDPDYENVQNY
ncbi:uncharacterized protein [Dendrobates tinctorius]|uniref:uncharacterized protein n=1 Tax=Dendrobates tinctorius TaxID=92724 RepID=UPI003CC9B934